MCKFRLAFLPRIGAASADVAAPDRTMKARIDDSGMTQRTAVHEDGSTYAWARLAVALVVMTISGASMYVVVVVLPTVQAEFGVARADASLPYTLTTIGFGIGGLFMGRLADRFGVMVPLLIGGGQPRPGLRRRRHGRQHLDVRPAARRPDRPARKLGDVRAADRRHVAMVHAAPRYRGRDLRQRQLRGRRDLAAGGAAFRRGVRLARHLYRHRRLLRAVAVGAGAAVQAPPAGRRCFRGQLERLRPPRADSLAPRRRHGGRSA